MGLFSRSFKILTYALMAFLCASSLSAQTYRFTNKIFQNISVTENVVYTNAPALNPGFFLNYNNESSTTNVDLKMDIHQAIGDTSSNRPAIIFIHGGAFLLGNKNHDDMMAFCDSFALLGYVTATIEYRLGMNILNNVSATRAVYRGLQDGRAAVRFLRANASNYGIDPKRIYMLGSSAGAFIALQDIYMNDDLEKPIEAGTYQFNDPYDFIPPFNQITAPDLGGFDIGKNLNQNGKPDAIIGLWGAIKHTDLITENDTTPVFLVHGTNDATVPFGIDHPFGFPIFPATYGSREINERLNNIDIAAKETYFVEGAGHEFYGVFNGNWSNGIGGNAYWDTIVNKSINFFYQQHKPQASFLSSKNNLEVSFTNTSNESKSWQWDFGDGQMSYEENPEHTYELAGTYKVKLYIENSIKSWDTTAFSITVTEPQTFETTFYINDGNYPIEAATIAINNQLLITDANGNANINLEDGNYAYQISATNYYNKLDTLIVNGNSQQIDIVLTKIPNPTFEISFYINDGINPILGASIVIDNQILISDEDGNALVNLENGTYAYTVSADAYDEMASELIVIDSNQNISIEMTLTTGVSDIDNTFFELYPNPAKELVYIDFPSLNQAFNIQIIDLTGKLLFEKETIQKDKVKIDLSKFRKGLYFIILQNGKAKYTKKIIIE